MFDEDPPLFSEILPNLWQGDTDDDETTYCGQKRLPTMSNPRPWDVVFTLDAYILPVGWWVKEYRFGCAVGPTDDEIYEEVE